MPTCMSKFEHAMWEFLHSDNNVVGFGGLEANGTSCQVNITLYGNSLIKSIDDRQGNLHPDQHNHRGLFTLLTLLLQLPPGSDSGSFCLAQHGLYVRIGNHAIIFIVFKGVSIHGTSDLTISKEDLRLYLIELGFWELWQKGDQGVRLAFINYTALQAYMIFAQLSMTPPLTFGNEGAPVAHKEKFLNFAQHGTEILGGRGPHANQMAREAVYAFINALSHSLITHNFTVNQLLGQLSWRGDKGEEQALELVKYDIISDPKGMLKFC
ncbi:hypothetical protein JAAARDRAFT_199796 [Jaapia argillacea MUCL 33604]|uniref:Uncharacterized protein n=1 Tax=Jaapia argillacea MUCL 33604 TaxID=933084 RepID=A0A067PI06_9AGAM|nr:hypothetical protein JAAARDRAFT_199796 [Jaapia argillacea MUCL 33604]